MPSYDETINELYTLLRLGIRPGLQCIRRLLSGLGDPHKDLKIIHIAGTNGKGSTSAMLESVLIEAGYRTGLFTSPHLIRLNERIRISGRDIPDKDVVEVVSAVRKAAGRQGLKPTFFEFNAAMAFHYFRKKMVDLAVVETGMGGRFDATTVSAPIVTVITNIAKDHTRHLGSGLGEIAREKAGIIKPGVPVITGAQRPTALNVIKKAARRKDASLYCLGADFGTTPLSSAGSNSFDYYGPGKEIKGLRLNLNGPFQIKNAACALAALEEVSCRGFPLRTSDVRRGLKNVRWPGRLEVVGKRGQKWSRGGRGGRGEKRGRGSTKGIWPLVVLDAAHNPDAARSFREAMAGHTYSRLILVVGILGDKDVRGILSNLAPLADVVVCTEPANPRAASAEELVRIVKTWKKPFSIKKDVAGAVAAALDMSGAKDAVCVTGSVFTVGEAMVYLKKVRPKP
jgi:dihydrofolate synthase/folylpolyglutamate synthase